MNQLEINQRHKSGVTLLELLITVTIIGIIAGVGFPSMAAGLDSIRLQNAAASVSAFFTSALNRVDRREETAALVISPRDSVVEVFTAASGDKPARSLHMPSGISIEGEEPRRFLLHPGGTAPAVTVVVRNAKGARRSIRIDPVTGISNVERNR